MNSNLTIELCEYDKLQIQNNTTYNTEDFFQAVYPLLFRVLVCRVTKTYIWI